MEGQTSHLSFSLKSTMPSSLTESRLEWTLLTRSQWPEAQYWEVTTSEYDQDLFLVAWGPTVAAVSYVFDIAEDKNIVQKAIGGFSKCASIAAHYEVTEVFDNLVISLCKFTTLLTTPEPPSSMAFTIGINHKVRLSILTLFSLAHRHGNILREGWKNMLDCLIVLYKAKLLPESMVEVEDFLHPGGRRSLFLKEVPSVRPDSSLFSSLFWWSSDTQTSSSRSLTPSEVKARKVALKCIQDCHPEQLFSESKFLCPEALQELTKALTDATRGSEGAAIPLDDDSAMFLMELLVTVAMENKGSGPLQERAIVSLIRLSSRLMGRPAMVSQVLRSIQGVLPLPQAPSMGSLHKQLAYGLHYLVVSHASCVKSHGDWSLLFSILQYSGTGLVQSDLLSPVTVETNTDKIESISIETGNVVANGGVAQHLAILPNRFSVLPEGDLPPHDPEAFFKQCEVLAHLVRSDHHISPNNFDTCLRCVCTFAEGGLVGFAPATDGRGPPGGKGVPGPLWHVAWCPLLLGMARMCYDSRRSVRQTSITYLQRALLAHDLHVMKDMT
eukprot:Em0002g1901a